MSGNIVPYKTIEQQIHIIRGQKVMLDKDLAALYGVKPIRLREQVKRNSSRFPRDFMFQLNAKEVNLMVSQNAIPSHKHLGGHRPYVFTEQGVAMLSSVLYSGRAIEVNIQIMRAFVKLREMMLTHKDLAHKINNLERKFKEHDDKFKVVFNAIKKLLIQEEKPKKKIGFHAG